MLSTIPCSGFLYLQFLARCHPYILISFLMIFTLVQNRSGYTDTLHVLIGITTGEIRNIVIELTCEVYQTLDSPGCASGFMSVGRMRLLLETGSAITTDQRQQITPDMRFTCDGMITKWIIGARWGSGDTLYPELQIWRNIGNDTYQKISGTFITPPTENDDCFYEYDDFSPIPVQTGDILGAFIPRTSMSRLSLLSEIMNTPINYILETGSSVTESPYDMIDIQMMPSLMSHGYHPLVTVEIGKHTLR